MILCLRLATCTWTTRQHPVSLGTVQHLWDSQMKVAPVLWQEELPTGFWQVSVVCLHSTPHTAAHLKRFRQASTSMQVPGTVVGLRQLSLRASLLLYLSCRSFPSCERLLSLCRKLLCCFPPHLRTARLSTCEPPKPQSFLTFAPAPLLPRPQPRHGKLLALLPIVVAPFADLFRGCSSPAHLALCLRTAGRWRRLRGICSFPTAFWTSGHRAKSEPTLPAWLHALLSSPRLNAFSSKQDRLLRVSQSFQRPKLQRSWSRRFASDQGLDSAQLLSVLLIAGGARTTFQGTLPGYLSHLCRLSCGGSTCYFHPVEEALLTGAISLYLSKLVQWMKVGTGKHMQPSQQWSCPLETALVAHSFGSLIAYSLAQQLETYGFRVPAIIALDLRSGTPRHSFNQLQPVALSQNRAPFNFHLETAKAAYMAPHAPRLRWSRPCPGLVLRKLATDTEVGFRA